MGVRGQDLPTDDECPDLARINRRRQDRPTGMSCAGYLTTGGAEYLDAGSGWSHRLGEDQRDSGRRRVANRFRCWVRFDQLRVCKSRVGEKGGGDCDDGDQKVPRESQE